MSVVELIGAEWVWLQSEYDRRKQECETAKSTPPPAFDEDALIARYRNLETAITHCQPKTPREAAAFAEVVCERIHIVETEYKLDAPIDESGRAAFALRDYLCDQIERDGASLRAELLSHASNREAEGPTLIMTLAAELAATWKSHGELDRAIIADRDSDNTEQLRKQFDSLTTKIRDLERAIASSRIQSHSELAVVLLLFAADLQDDCNDRFKRDALIKLWTESIAEYEARRDPILSGGILQHYVAKFATAKLRIAKEAA